MNVNTYIKRFIIRPVYNTPNDFPVEALVTDKLEIVYEAYAHAMGVRPKDIQFMHQGKMLTDIHTVHSANIVNKSILYAFIY